MTFDSSQDLVQPVFDLESMESDQSGVQVSFYVEVPHKDDSGVLAGRDTLMAVKVSYCLSPKLKIFGFLPLTLSLSHTHTHTLFLSLSLSHTHTHTHTLPSLSSIICRPEQMSYRLHLVQCSSLFSSPPLSQAQAHNSHLKMRGRTMRNSTPLWLLG